MAKTQKQLHRKSRYGIEQEEFDDYLYFQGSECAICLKELDLGPTTHIDHDHETGEIRGILCVNCNLMLGLANDSPLILLKAIDYLQNPPARFVTTVKKIKY